MRERDSLPPAFTSLTLAPPYPLGDYCHTSPSMAALRQHSVKAISPVPQSRQAAVRTYPPALFLPLARVSRLLTLFLFLLLPLAAGVIRPSMDPVPASQEKISERAYVSSTAFRQVDSDFLVPGF